MAKGKQRKKERERAQGEQHELVLKEQMEAMVGQDIKTPYDEANPHLSGLYGKYSWFEPLAQRIRDNKPKTVPTEPEPEEEDSDWVQVDKDADVPSCVMM